MAQNLTTSRGAALYIGAILGPGLLLLPGLAAAEAGPASILAWLALLGLSGLFAAVFSALGRQIPSASGVMGYVTAGLGSRAGRATGWMFLAGVVGGAPIVCLIGASYVTGTFTGLTGGGQGARAAVAAVLLLTVLGLAAGGLRASATAQLVLVSLLTVVVVVAVTGSASAARVSHWTPFAPHGWLSVGSAAATLMFSFAGWEAVAPLTTRFADPARQLPRAVAIALAVTTVLYLGLAVATISVLGPSAATDIPLAALLSHAIGTAGPDAAAVAAIVLTLGATNAYINGAAALAGQLAGGSRSTPMVRLLAAIGVAGLLLIGLYGLGVVGTAALVAVPTVLFLTVYLGVMTAAVRVLRGRVRLAALPAGLAVAVMLGFCGWALALPLLIALAVFRPLAVRRRSAGLEVDGVPGGRVGGHGLEVVAQGVGTEGDQADRRGAVHAAIGQFVPDDDRGRVGVGQAVAVGQREPVAPGVLDRGGRVGVGTVRGELGAEMPGLGVRVRKGLRCRLPWGLFRGRRVGVAGVGDDVGLVWLEVLQGGAGAVPAEHERGGQVGADQQERVVTGQCA
jgi:amino acid efflux transporter